ncbi:MAG: hypothetical protein U5L96_11295 [Owenweeksia sp.]|nr:hypothetical protein [Owenweeksia sp.]
MGQLGIKFFFLLTLIVGFMMPVVSQVNPSDSLPVADTAAISPDSLLSPPAADTALQSLSTDSVYATPSSQNGLLESMVEYTATDSIHSLVSSREAFLYRDAYVKYEGFELKAGYIHIDFAKSEIYAEGIEDSTGKVIQKPVFIEAGKTYRANHMRYNFETRKARISKVITQEGDGFLHGEKVKKTGQQVFYVRNAAYTTWLAMSIRTAILLPPKPR